MPYGWKEWEEEVKKYGPKEGPIYKAVSSDFRFHHAIKNCMRCGTCVSICPAAHFNNYNPRDVMRIMMDGNDSEILDLLREKVNMCAQCHYCLVRCPRRNQPAIAIIILRDLSHEWGLAVESMKAFTRVLKCIMMTGTQISPDMIQGDFFPDWGPKTKRMGNFIPQLRARLGAKKEGEEGLRGVDVLSGVESAWRVHPETVRELQKIWQMDGSLKRLGIASPFLQELVEEEIEDYKEEEG